MPELPEMETYKHLLSQRTIGETITGARINREKSVNVPADQLIRDLTGRRMIAIERRAKHLLFHLDSGHVLLLHLMLGGWMYYGTDDNRPDRTTQVEIDFGNGQTLYFIGLRLGYLHWLAAGECERQLRELGPEPLSPHFSEHALEQLLGGKRGTLKPLLINQHKLSGIGNCYSDEICFEAGVLPTKPLEDLTTGPSGDSSRLYHSMRKVLTDAIHKGGYMEHPLFVGDALTGGYNDHCQVYDRGGEPCLRCGTLIVQTSLSSRKVFFCPQCQH